jgi:hypothetical protein
MDGPTTRDPKVERMLERLGFSAPTRIEVGTVTDKVRAEFAKAKLSVELSGPTIRVRRDRALLVEAPPVDGGIHDALLIGGKTVVVFYGRAGSEGCEATDPQGVTVISIP